MILKTNIKNILLFAIITICFSCSEKKKALKKKEENKIGSLYTMQPFDNNLPDLKSSEKEKLRQPLKRFMLKIIYQMIFQEVFLSQKTDILFMRIIVACLILKKKHQ